MVLYIDGQSQGNEQRAEPRSARIAVAFTESGKNDPQGLRIYWRFLGDKTNNEAEYHALLEALALIARRWTDNATGRISDRVGEVLIRSDSKLVISQVKGEWRVDDPKLVELNSNARKSIGKLGQVRLEWVPRENNYAGLWLEGKLKPLTVEKISD
jgi:ribonuclease HI